MARALTVFLSGCLLLMVWGGVVQATEDQEPVPIIEVKTRTYDFGQIFQGEIVKHDFRVMNRGAAPLEIKNVKPG